MTPKTILILVLVLASAAGMASCERIEPLRESDTPGESGDPEVRARIFEEIGQLLGVEPDSIKEGDRFIEDLGADELDFVEMVMATEEMFGFPISDEDAERIETAGDLVRYVEERLKETSAAQKNGAASGK